MGGWKKLANRRGIAEEDKWGCKATKQKKGSPQDLSCKASLGEYGFELATTGMGQEASLIGFKIDGIDFKKEEPFKWQAPSTTGGFYRDLKPGYFTFEERKGE